MTVLIGYNMSMAIVRIPMLTCLRCGHRWVPRIPDVRLCARCKSARWDQPKRKTTRGRPRKK